MKTCSKCIATKELSEFHIRNSKKGTYQSYCKSCRKDMDKEFHSKNADRRNRERRGKRQELYEWVNALKSKLVCLRCGENHPACIDFHHRDREEKSINIARAIGQNWSLELIKIEIEKCDALCSNCHRILHWEEKHQSVAGNRLRASFGS